MVQQITIDVCLSLCCRYDLSFTVLLLYVVVFVGAGIASSIHMPVGTKYCCGVIEIFPEGEFKQTRGYGTIARRMGHRYERIDISSNFTEASGTAVPLHVALGVLDMMTKEIYKSGSCLLPAVIASPFL